MGVRPAPARGGARQKHTARPWPGRRQRLALREGFEPLKSGGPHPSADGGREKVAARGPDVHKTEVAARGPDVPKKKVAARGPDVHKIDSQSVPLHTAGCCGKKNISNQQNTKETNK